MECKSEPNNPIGYFDILIRLEIVDRYKNYQNEVIDHPAYNKDDDTYYNYSADNEHFYKPLTQFFERHIESELREQFEYSKLQISLSRAENHNNPSKFIYLVENNIINKIENLYNNHRQILDQFPILYRPLEGIKQELIRNYPESILNLELKLIKNQILPSDFTNSVKEVFEDLKSLKSKKSRLSILNPTEYDLLSQYLFDFYSDNEIQIKEKISFNGIAVKVINCYFYLFNKRIPIDIKTKSEEEIAKFMGDIIEKYKNNDVKTATTRLKAPIPISHKTYMTERLITLFFEYELFMK